LEEFQGLRGIRRQGALPIGHMDWNSKPSMRTVKPTKARVQKALLMISRALTISSVFATLACKQEVTRKPIKSPMRTQSPAAQTKPTTISYNEANASLTFHPSDSSKTFTINEVIQPEISKNYVGFLNKSGGGALYHSDGTPIVNDKDVILVRSTKNASGYINKNGTGTIILKNETATNASNSTSDLEITISSNQMFDIQMNEKYVGYLEKDGGHVYEFKAGRWNSILKELSITQIEISENYFGYVASETGGVILTKDGKTITQSLVTDIWVSDYFAAFRTKDRKFYLQNLQKKIIDGDVENEVVVAGKFAGFVDSDNQAVIFNKSGEKIFNQSGISKLWLSDVFYAYYSEENKKGAIVKIDGQKILTTMDQPIRVSVSNTFVGFVENDRRGAIFKADGSQLPLHPGNLKDIQVSDLFAGYVNIQAVGEIWRKDSTSVETGIDWKTIKISNRFAVIFNEHSDAKIFDSSGTIATAENVREIIATDFFAGYLTQWPNSAEGDLVIYGPYGNQFIKKKNVLKAEEGVAHLAFIQDSTQRLLFTMSPTGNVKFRGGKTKLAKFKLDTDNLEIVQMEKTDPTVIININSNITLGK
jgi:hypothetical protein